MLYLGGLSGVSPGRRTPLGARPLEAAISGARGYCGPDPQVYRTLVVSRGELSFAGWGLTLASSG